MSNTASQSRERAKSVDRDLPADNYGPKIKLFNGATRTATEWNNLRRDPDLCRNFFAWLCRRPLVGEHLGWALAGLINSMRELRDPCAENVKDLIDYMEQEGYLNMRNNPSHALAILYVAETYQLRGMYVDAFAHCTGMFWDLEASAEYQMTRLNRGSKLKPDERLLAHASLVKAYNAANPHIIHNDLVQAYRRFEEDLVMSPNKLDKKEKLSLPDGRKLRWAIVYATCQVLRNITDAPREVFDTDDIDYHIAISTENLPPWKRDATSRPRTPKQQQERDSARQLDQQDGPVTPSKGPTTPRHRSTLSEGLRSPSRLGRSISHRAKTLSQSLQASPSKLVRRPLSVFRSPGDQNPPGFPDTTLKRRRACGARPRHNQRQVQIEEAPMTATSASSVHDSVVSSNGAGTAASSIATSPEASPKHERAEVCWSEPPPVPQRRRREVVSMLPSPEMPLRSNLRPRPQSAIFESPSRSPARQALAPDYAIDYAQLVEEQREEIYKGECDADEKLMPSPLRIKRARKVSRRTLPEMTTVFEGGSADWMKP
ncbi:unnamed protein product [Parascedosporium putredinis]|uniref:DUF8004 domain-containing protein n=1 Tax=Parascedosporium putredinis TaxID=1442378 RepID=A0A9P1MC70_9PEZI|nr:unnamed protein product [Parascedosporium putredinis]CAI8001025.1 unnamed protein product [Parascedosporium putredinis]